MGYAKLTVVRSPMPWNKSWIPIPLRWSDVHALWIIYGLMKIGSVVGIALKFHLWMLLVLPLHFLAPVTKILCGTIMKTNAWLTAKILTIQTSSITALKRILASAGKHFSGIKMKWNALLTVHKFGMRRKEWGLENAPAMEARNLTHRLLSVMLWRQRECFIVHGFGESWLL